MARSRRSTLGIPGLSFSWKRAVGLTAARQSIARRIGVPTTLGGIERRIGRLGTRGCLPVVSVWLFVVAALVFAARYLES